jgi:hypothetical protein
MGSQTSVGGCSDQTNVRAHSRERSSCWNVRMLDVQCVEHTAPQITSRMHIVPFYHIVLGDACVGVFFSQPDSRCSSRVGLLETTRSMLFLRATPMSLATCPFISSVRQRIACKRLRCSPGKCKASNRLPGNLFREGLRSGASAERHSMRL